MYSLRLGEIFYAWVVHWHIGTVKIFYLKLDVMVREQKEDEE
jgi:hypothetical protein